MATIHFRNAKVLVDGYDLSGDHTSVTVAMSAEMLDETSMGDTTRIRKGGLTICDVTGAGYFNTSAGTIDRVMFGIVGSDDKLITVFPDGITEGGTQVGAGFSMKGVVDHYNLQGDVGSLLGFEFAVMGRGIV